MSAGLHHYRSHRFGSVSLIGLLLLVIFLLLFVWVVLSGQTRYQRERLQVAADSAALAAAEEMVDDCWLSGDANVIYETLKRSRHVAGEFSERNPIQGKGTLLFDNPTNHRDGDIVFGHFPLTGDQYFQNGPTFGGDEDDAAPGRDRLDAVRIVINRDKDHDDTQLRVVSNPGSGGARIDGRAAAIAVLDRFVYGFRPIKGQAIPFVPIALYSGSDAHCWESQCSQNGRNDNYKFSRESQSFATGSDGIPEMTVRLGTRPSNDGNSVTGLLVLTADADLNGDGKVDFADAIAQISTGLRAEQLNGGTFGGRIALGDDGLLDVYSTDDVQSKKSDRQSIYSALKTLKNTGYAFVFPLYKTRSNGQNQSSTVLCGFVAARIVSVEQRQNKNDGSGDDEQDADDDSDSSSAKSIVLVLQPAMISVSAAMTDARRTVGGQPIAPNPYIAKVRLGR
jgi:hypothetical protein